MAHQVNSSLSGVPDESKRVKAIASRLLAASPLMSLLVLFLALASGLSGSAQTTPSPYVPAVVVTSVSTVPVPTPPLGKNQTTYGTSQGDVTPVYSPTSLALDSCGNIYTLDQGSDTGKSPGGRGDLVTEIPANGGYATVVENVGGYENVPIGQDPLRKFILVGHQYSNSSLNLVPVANCIPNASQQMTTGGGSGALFYYYNIAASGADFANNYYISTDQICCVSDNYNLIQEAGGNGNILLSNTKQPNFTQADVFGNLAVDLNQNVYFIATYLGPYVYQLAFSGGTGGTYAIAPVQFGKAYQDPVGLSVDINSNLYIVDRAAATLYEIPYEVNSSGVGALNPADQFIVASGFAGNVAGAVDARGDVYFTNQNATAVSKLSLGNANFGAVAIGQTVNLTLTFQFNAAVTPAAVQLPTGVFGTTSGGKGFGQCTAGTAYGPTGTSYCQMIVTFAPTAVGKQSSSVVLADASGNSIATAYIEGVGQGSLITLDPGTAQPTGSGLKSPTGIAVDQLGNTYIADSASSSVTEFPAGGGAAVPLTVSVVTPACGTASASSAPPPALPLAAPTGVAVDGPGNVYIADTGNNRIIKVPFINGALSLSSAATVGACSNGANAFSAPASVFVQTNGDLYVTDTGNNRIVLFPSLGTAYGSPIDVATGLSSPLAMTADATGNVFIANSGTNTIVEIPLGGKQELVDAGILNPSGMSTDTSGALFVVDQGNFRVLRIPSASGVLSVNDAAEVALGIANPYGVTLDSTGNLFVTDSVNASAYTINRSQVSLSFGDLAVGTPSDSLPLTVESAGNLPLIFNTPYFVATGDTGDFAMTSPTGACGDGITLLPGSSCGLTTTFTPTATGARSDAVAFSSNSGTTPQVVLAGSGISLGTTATKLGFTYAAGVGAPFYGEPLVFTATISGTGTPTGSVSFVIDGVQTGLLPLASGVATLPLNSGLTGGGHTIYAVYKGDSANDGSSSAPLSITIAKAPTTSVVAVNRVAYNNPYSLKHSNAGSCSIAEVEATAAHPTTFAAIVSDPVGFTGTVSSPGVGIPSGALTFFVDGVVLNSANTSSNAPSSIAPVAPTSAGFTGSVTSDADTLGDGDMLGENNILIAPHQITVVYSGDQNYLPSTSLSVLVNVVDVSPTTPITLPHQPIGTPPTYCAPGSAITKSQPSDPATYEVQLSANTVAAASMVPGTVQMSLFSLGGYNGFVDFSCTGLPKYTTCTVNPGQALLQPSTPGINAVPPILTLTIATNVEPYTPTAGQSRFLWLPSLLLGIAVLSSRRRFKQFKTTLSLFGLALLLIGGLTGLSGCGSGTANTLTGSASNVVTPAGTYPIQIVMQGSQVDTNTYDGGNNLDFQPDLPFSVPLTLVVK